MLRHKIYRLASGTKNRRTRIRSSKKLLSLWIKRQNEQATFLDLTLLYINFLNY